MIKKLENFWKGLSNEVKQISPIAPEGYGDRFIKFITGITKTREEAEREEAEAAAQDAEESAISPTTGRKRSGSQHLHRTATDNTVIQRAEAQAAISEEQGAHEDDRPERTLVSVRSPSTERGVQGTILPIVEEAGEASSTGGKSGHEVEDRPPTPAKDYTNKNVKNVQATERRPPTPPKDVIHRLAPADSMSVKSVRSVKSAGSLNSWKDKALPIPPNEGKVGKAF